jgi:hypothetical protein
MEVGLLGGADAQIFVVQGMLARTVPLMRQALQHSSL